MPEDPSLNPPFTETCPDCKESLMFGWTLSDTVAVYICNPCKLKVRQGRKAGIIHVSSLQTLTTAEVRNE